MSTIFEFDAAQPLTFNPFRAGAAEPPRALPIMLRVAGIRGPRATRFKRLSRLWHWALHVIDIQLFRCRAPQVVLSIECQGLPVISPIGGLEAGESHILGLGVYES